MQRRLGHVSTQFVELPVYEDTNNHRHNRYETAKFIIRRFLDTIEKPSSIQA